MKFLPRLDASFGKLQIWWQRLCEAIEKAFADNAAAQATADSAQDTAIAAQADATQALADAFDALTAAAVAQSAAEGKIDEPAADLRYVRQDIGPAWTTPTGTASRATFATYAGQTISNPPTQAEVQAIDNHAVVISQRLAAMIDDLKANGALT